jgi:hypothetical protein
MLLAYDADGNVIATLSYLLQYDAAGVPLGFVDFTGHEEAGLSHTEIWTVDSGSPDRPVKGSKVWPEWLAGRAQDYRVELAGEPGHKRIAALVHKKSGHRRERAAIEAAIAAVEPDANGARDIRHLVGGPDRPLKVDGEGQAPSRAKTRPIDSAATM